MSPRRAAVPAWLAYLAVGVLVCTAYFLVSPDDPDLAPIRIVLYCAVSASAAIAVFAGVARHRPRPTLAWLLIGAGQLVYAVADACFYVAHYLLGDLTYPALADLFYLSHYPLTTAGLIILIRQRSRGRDLPGLLDAATLAVAAAMLSWLFLISPQTGLSVPTLIKVTSLAYPVLDLALLAVSMRLLLGGGRRPTAFLLLAGNLLAMLTADAIYVLQLQADSYRAGNYLDAIWLAGNLLLGAAALHRTMPAVGERAESSRTSIGPARIAILCSAALLAPATLWIQYLRGDLLGVPAIALAYAVLFGLTVARLTGLVIEQRTLAITDSLTGLHTRRFLEAQLQLEVTRAQRTNGSVALCIIDVDRFKSVNDRYGHPAGDRALIEIARRLRLGSGPGDLLARYGGEEFALLVPDSAADRLDELAERLRSAVSRSPIQVGRDARTGFTVSIGVAGYPQHGQTPAELVEVADRALYAAKDAGRDRVVIGIRERRRPAPDEDAAVTQLLRIADQVDTRSDQAGRGRAVGRWCVQLCTALRCADGVVQRAELAGRLHGIGKVVVPEPTPTGSPPDHRELLLSGHPEHGYRLVRTIAGLEDVATVIRQQHLHFDGAGAPLGPAGEAITREARVLAVCAAWATLCGAGGDREPLPAELAIVELRAGRGSRFDPTVLDAFLDLHRRGRLAPWDRPAPAAMPSAGY